MEFNEGGGGDGDDFIKHSRSEKKSNGLQVPGGLTWNITVQYFIHKSKRPILGLSHINPVDRLMPLFIVHFDTRTVSFF